MYPIPGVWILASLVGAVGMAMQVRWALTRTDEPKARTSGLVRAAVVQTVGLAGLLLTAAGQTIVIGLAIMLGIGTIIGFAAARALHPPG